VARTFRFSGGARRRPLQPLVRAYSRTWAGSSPRAARLLRSRRTPRFETIKTDRSA